MQYTIHYYLNTISPKGRIAWEYNPLHNFRRTRNTDKNGLHSNQIKLYGQLYTLISKDIDIERYKDINGNTLVLNYNEGEINTVYLNGKEISSKDIKFYSDEDNIEAGSIVDLDTELLNFSLNNPVQIEIQPSYDGSVNLILNDDRNPPRLINSRFSTKELNTYEIVDRIGDNDTNIYDDDVNQFDLDTSLYKKYNRIPKVIFNKVITGGNLKVGNYVLYFRYCDADENETDFVAESGIIAIFKGNDKDPFSIDGGFLDMNAHKSIDVTLINIDEAYDYIKVYYTRSSSDLDQNRQTTAHKLVKKFVVSRNQCHIVITGDEENELIPVTDLTSEYFIADAVKTQAQCQNMLFLGNVSRPDPLHQDLTDLSIRMLPYFKGIDSSKLIGYIEPSTYIDLQNVYNNYEYYNTKNIYYNVGYWNEEMYRIGVVYIMYDNTLSKVYNIRGCEVLPDVSEINEYYTPSLDIFDDEGNRQYIEVSEDDYSIVGGKYLENSRGVVRFADFQQRNEEQIYSLGITIPKDVLLYLKNYCGIKGLFFVRQKRMPTILAQGLTLPIDPESRVPLIYLNTIDSKEQFFIESFISQEKIKSKLADAFKIVGYNKKEVIHDYDKRLIFPEDLEESKIKNSNCAAILCPDYEVRQQYFNQFFTGTDFPISYSNIQYGDIVNVKDRERFYTHDGYKFTSYNNNYGSGMMSVKLISVSEEVPEVAIGDNIFRGFCGTAQEGFRYRFAFKEGSKTKSDTNLVRGIWHPYVGAVFNNKVNYGKLVNIYIPGYNISELSNYYKVRYNDNSPYYPISDRMGIDDLTTYEFDSNTGYKLEFFRGDCYFCTFTHRLNRNFQDPAAPANDIIIDKDSFAKFDPEDRTTFNKINLGDINAVKMGSWYTFKVKSSTNLSIRSLDESHLEEKGIFGLPRGFYPLQQELLSGSNKIPDSYNVNDGYRSLFGEKFYLRYPDVPYIKNNFDNRILYSQIAVNDAFRNGYRVFKSTHFNDYSKEYGSIIKLVTMSSQGLQNGLLCVFEHAVGYIPVNERAVAGEGAGGNVYINTSNVLPDNPRIVSDKFGSQWQDSIVQTPYYVYGVDTVAKKIWRSDGSNLEVISDFKLNKFLVDNITLTEKELTPIIGVRNVKTHYNANKGDVMFTFYDNQYGIEEKVWNLCWNEITQSFTTFYSWVPSYSENIDNIFFSFDRETSKAIAKLGTSQVGSTNADGIVLTNVILDNEYKTNIAGLVNRIKPDIGDITYKYTIIKDPYENYKYFTLTDDNILTFIGDPEDSNNKLQLLNGKKVWYVFIKCEITVNNSTVKDYDAYIRNWDTQNLKYNYGQYESVVAVTSQDVFNNYIKYEKDQNGNYRQIKSPKYGYKQIGENEEYSGRKYIHYNNEYLLMNSEEYIKVTDNNESSRYELLKEYQIQSEETVETDNNEQYVIYIKINDNFIEKPNYYKYVVTGDSNNVETLTSDFWKHGQAGIIDIKDQILPCQWYGKQHPFEFEFVVRDTPNMHKIFDNLEIISNKAEPESFHFEVVGETYEFANDKPNMYYRQEATKEMWQKAGVNITFDKNYTEISPVKNKKSTIFPLYVSRIDTYDNIYDYYTEITDSNDKNYRNLSGSEIIRDKQLNEYRIRTHIKNSPITDKKVGRLRGNSHYKEDRWKIQIPAIAFMQKNEDWENKPPIVINYIPEDHKGDSISSECLPNTYTRENIEIGDWTYRKETKIRDKYMKVRIRYEGSQLAVIQAVLTTYTESYS